MSFSNPLKLLLCLYYKFSLSDCTLIYLSPSVSFISSKLNSNVIFPNCFPENVFIFSRVTLFLFLLLFVLFCFSKVLYNRNLELSHRWLSWGYTSNSSCNVPVTDCSNILTPHDIAIPANSFDCNFAAVSVDIDWCFTCLFNNPLVIRAPKYFPRMFVNPKHFYMGSSTTSFW